MIRIKDKILFYVGLIIHKLKFLRSYKIKPDKRPDSDFTLVFFSGHNGINYLNASLYSVYKSWKKLPPVKIIVEDETPIDTFKNKILKWPKRLTIISWKTCAEYYRHNGNINLYEYAIKDIWGKKLISILHCAQKEKIIYTDTDVLWFNDPDFSYPKTSNPYIKMGLDATKHWYSKELVEHLDDDIFSTPPLNAGVLLIHGDFSCYPKWNLLCEFLAKYPGSFTEQTTFAVLANYFGENWSQEEIMLQINDKTEIFPKLYKGEYEKIFARHYVNMKPWLFWRDFYFFIATRRKLNAN